MALDESLIGKVAELPRKQWEYAVVSSVTLSTRAAILGGVPPATAYALSDTMLQKLSKCTDLSGIIQLSGEVRLTFASCVRDFRDQRCSYSIIEEAKTYMRTNLNKDITKVAAARIVSCDRRSYISVNSQTSHSHTALC
ncbi:MAG: hypothetical protein LUC95_07180 [Lachnospiraceae bacterium]|nr:hypothetical protein [Lachnospiraceae bacterium]